MLKKFNLTIRKLQNKNLNKIKPDNHQDPNQ